MPLGEYLQPIHEEPGLDKHLPPYVNRLRAHVRRIADRLNAIQKLAGTAARNHTVLKEEFASGTQNSSHFCKKVRLLRKVMSSDAASDQVKEGIIEGKRLGVSSTKFDIAHAFRAQVSF